MKNQPKITVGIMDRQAEVAGHLNGEFYGNGLGSIGGPFSAEAASGTIVLLDGSGHQLCRSPEIRLASRHHAMFGLFNVTIGKRFHWERREDQTFQGDLILRLRKDGSMVVINEIFLEDYLESVISSEMKATAPLEFLKTHAIIARSWLLATLHRGKPTLESSVPTGKDTRGEVIRWYDREDHDLFDVCADDHCQRYQGMTKIISRQATEAVRQTYGTVITYQDEICDTRYSKACGGFTENFESAWGDKQVPYLTSVPDSPVFHRPIQKEEEVSAWILSSPDVYCNTVDEDFLAKILPDFDQQTKHFFRWKVEYTREDLEEILLEKSGFDFGTLQEIVPLERGPSGRISRLRVVGSKRSMIVGKELEIRRWLSRTHLYSSAFIVSIEGKRFTFHGAGWGHGVGLCQIGAAVMATRGFKTEEILDHYFRGSKIERVYGEEK